MPMYLYAIVEPDGSDGDTFELLQNLGDAPLTVHPETGQPVHRLLTAPSVRTSGSKPKPAR